MVEISNPNSLDPDDGEHVVRVTTMEVEVLLRQMKELGEEMEEVQRQVYEGTFSSLQEFLSGVGGWCTERGLIPLTITPTGDETSDFLNMLRAVRGMADDILAAESARSTGLN